MRKFLALIAVVAMAATGWAAEIKTGASLRVKTNSIWFDTSAQLAHWQALKRRSDGKGAAKYQEKLMRKREAWQFLNPLGVVVKSYDAKKRWVEVELTDEGRMKGAVFWIDADAIEP